MSLKTEINQTEILKNKTKKAKDNINAKLIELGGQNATDLADIPNKMQSMIGQYKKFARGQMQTSEYNDFDDLRPLKLNLNLAFSPRKLVVYLVYTRNNSVIGVADSDINTSRDSAYKIYDRAVEGVWIQNLNTKSADLYAGLTRVVSHPNASIKWFAIG